MALRFADLPLRTKFLVTLGIPVVGLVLLIGKQVDSSLKRRDVLQYINSQSRNIELLADLLVAVREENNWSLGLLNDLGVNPQRVVLRHARTDESARRLGDPSLNLVREVRGAEVLEGIGVLRQRVLERRIGVQETDRAYRRMKVGLLDDLGRVGKLALDPQTKDRLYSHLSLLNATDALSNTRSLLEIALAKGGLSEAELGDLFDQIALYGTNLFLFERDAPPEVLALYAGSIHGNGLERMRTMIGIVMEKRAVSGMPMDAREWHALGDEGLQALDQVAAASIQGIIKATAANQRDAELRLLLVLLALLGVIGAVTVMAIIIMRGIRRTVSEVTEAASALAEGDVSVTVPVTSNDEFGGMARSFNRMIENARALSASAESIGRGNYDIAVPVRGADDLLGHALTRMKENLRSAREMDAAQKMALEREKEKLEQANARIHVLIKEIHHRVKNNLQVIASLLRLQAANITDERLQQVFDQSQSRVTSMALIHEKLYRGDELVHLDLALYIKELFSELVHLNNVRDTIQCEADVERGLEFDLNTMVPLGLVLNELITNSFKHAFAGRDHGHVSLVVRRAGRGQFDLIYSDDGVGMPQEKLSPEGSSSLGVSLIESLVEQLNGHLTVDSGAHGTRYHIRFRA